MTKRVIGCKCVDPDDCDYCLGVAEDEASITVIERKAEAYDRIIRTFGDWERWYVRAVADVLRGDGEIVDWAEERIDEIREIRKNAII